MPELPEVETIARRLRSGTSAEPALVGRSIAAVHVLSERVLKEPAKAALARRLHGAHVVDVTRRAKHLLITTDRGVLLVHLRMTGDLHVRPRDPPPRFLRLALDLEDDHRGGAGAGERRGGPLQLQLTDTRHLGEVRLVDDPAPLLAELGPEPLDPAFGPDELAARLKKSERAIKAALMDQSVIGGVGNIYADEALWRARIWPERPVSSLSPAEVKRVLRGIKDALEDNIASLAKDDLDVRWRYLDRTSASPFAVYDRGGEPCRRCRTPLDVLEVGGRTTVACPVCQARPAGDRATTPRRSSRAPLGGRSTTERAARASAAVKRPKRARSTP